MSDPTQAPDRAARWWYSPPKNRVPADDECDAINALTTEYDRGNLSNMAWNARNRYLSHPYGMFDGTEVRMLVEGFLAEIQAIREGRKEAMTDTADPMFEGGIHILVAELVGALTRIKNTHQPEWTSEKMKKMGKDPIGCETCYPADGSWPCVTRLEADEALAAYHGQRAGLTNIEGSQ